MKSSFRCRPSGFLSQNGFSLLEVLVAFVIMAMALAALYQAAGRSVRNVGASSDLAAAGVVAESLLAQHRVVPVLGLVEEGVWSDGRAWRIQAQPYPTEATQTLADPGAWALYRLQVEVDWQGAQGEQTLQLTTLVPGASP